MARGGILVYLQGSNGDADIENRLVDTEREREGGTNGESSTETYTLPYVKWIASCNLLPDSGTQTRALQQPRGVGGRFKREEGYRSIYIPVPKDRGTWQVAVHRVAQSQT